MAAPDSSPPSTAIRLPSSYVWAALGFALVGLVAAGFYYWGLFHWWKAQSWVEVPCLILKAELEESEGEDSTLYQAKATYRYDYAGRSYEGGRISFLAGKESGTSFHHRVHRELQGYLPPRPRKGELERNHSVPQKMFHCFVDPSQPDQAVLYRDLRWGYLSVVAVFAALFTSFGIWMAIMGRPGFRQSAAEAALKLEFPAQPWRWRLEWTGEFIPEQQTSWNMAMPYLAAWLSLIVLPLLFAMGWSGAFTEWRAYTTGIVAAILCGVPLIKTLNQARHRRAVGQMRLKLHPFPARPGSPVSGALVFDHPRLPDSGEAKLSLVCRRRVEQRDSEGSSIKIDRIGSYHLAIPISALRQNGLDWRLPFLFPALPSDAPESSSFGQAEPGIDWRLEFRVPGTAVRSEFKVPVFCVNGDETSVTEMENRSMIEAASVELPERLHDMGFPAEFDAAGLPLSIHCSPRRHRKKLAFLVVFNLFWIGVAVFLVRHEGPLIAQYIWTTTSSAIWLSIFCTALHHRVVRLLGSELKVENTLGPFAWQHRLTAAEVQAFTAEESPTKQAAEGFIVRLWITAGKKFLLVDKITERATADALAERFETWRRANG